MLTKESVTKQVETMPESFSLDDLIERLILVEKIETGLKQVQDGQVVKEKELDKEMESWFG